MLSSPRHGTVVNIEQSRVCYVTFLLQGVLLKSYDITVVCVGMMGFYCAPAQACDYTHDTRVVRHVIKVWWQMFFSIY